MKIVKKKLIELLGGTNTTAARALGYSGLRADNNISRLPDVLTERQSASIVLRMKANRIKVPVEWK